MTGELPLLTTSQMATFVARGFLPLPGIIPEEINQAAIAELGQIMATWGSPDRPYAPSTGQHLADIYPDGSAIGDVLRHPIVAGAIQSLVGADPVFDHDFVHHKPAGDPLGQYLHQDAMVDPSLAFDLQVFYFPHEVLPGGGGTGFVPGTHLRRVHETDVGRYVHMAGERQWEGPAGSILLFHQGMWHRGMPNPSDRDRLMYKIRLNPTAPQVRLWDTSDLDGMQNGAEDHVFARFRSDSVAGILRHRERWLGEADYRLELANRAALWRYLTGDDGFDVDYYLTRTEVREAIV
ncbi:phytanoyl-CoA dioxygenase family protein [Actinospongicola halichondriae]|uniref:phytanoyl-CoA dioxygenase family protein n=1 Tax=Actinospongicola halichondriae TaxID=3236844 RepID=UPI003D4AC32E